MVMLEMPGWHIANLAVAEVDMMSNLAIVWKTMPALCITSVEMLTNLAISHLVMKVKKQKA